MGPVSVSTCRPVEARQGRVLGDGLSLGEQGALPGSPLTASLPLPPLSPQAGDGQPAAPDGGTRSHCA